MDMRYEVPDGFWGLFRSVNMETYMEALLAINEEYEYSNYFLTKETCIAVLSDLNAKRRYELLKEDDESDIDMLETPASRILNWLIKKGWLKKIEDYNEFKTNIVIPDYAAILIEAFEKLTTEDIDEAEVYIYSIYATLSSFRTDPRMNLGMLRSALANTKKLNKTLQDMLHNMDRFFERLLDKESYGELLEEHLDGYVEDIVKKKYHILKTSDNFYLYKMDIKKVLQEMREDDRWIEMVRQRALAKKDTKYDVLDLIDMIERGFDDIEHRIANMDREHSKYVRATVTRLNYLLSGETDTKGLIVQLLNKMAESEDDDVTKMAASKMNLSLPQMISETSLYKRRKERKDFISKMAVEETVEDLDKEDILKANKVQVRFTKQEIEEFIESNMTDEVMDTSVLNVSDDETFEKLILAYDLSTRRKSKYMVLKKNEIVKCNGYTYPGLQFIRK